MTESALYILSLDAKDIAISNGYTDGSEIGYSTRYRSGEYNLRRYKNTLDYSLESIKLREVYEKVYRRNNFSFSSGGKDYTDEVVNVTFLYNLKEFNNLGGLS